MGLKKPQGKAWVDLPAAAQNSPEAVQAADQTAQLMPIALNSTGQVAFYLHQSTEEAADAVMEIMASISVSSVDDEMRKLLGLQREALFSGREDGRIALKRAMSEFPMS